MSKAKYTIMGSWPVVNDSPRRFPTDPEFWTISQLKPAPQSDHRDQLMEATIKIMDYMEMMSRIRYSNRY